MDLVFVTPEGYNLGIMTEIGARERYFSLGYVEVPAPMGFYYRAIYDFVNEIWVEGATPEEIDQINYTNELQTELQKTYQRQLDGNAYFIEFSSILSLKQNREEITQAERNSIDDILKEFKDSILCGYYKTALRKLNDFTTLQIEEVGTDLYNKIKTDVENYIMYNYNDPSLTRGVNSPK